MSEDLICPHCNELLEDHDDADVRACMNVLARRQNRYECPNCDVGLPSPFRHCPACSHPGPMEKQEGSP